MKFIPVRDEKALIWLVHIYLLLRGLVPKHTVKTKMVVLLSFCIFSGVRLTSRKKQNSLREVLNNNNQTACVMTEVDLKQVSYFTAHTLFF